MRRGYPDESVCRDLQSNLIETAALCSCCLMGRRIRLTNGHDFDWQVLKGPHGNEVGILTETRALMRAPNFEIDSDSEWYVHLSFRRG